MKNAARRIPLGDSIDTVSIITDEALVKKHMRIAKWNWSSMPIRCAAAGLEANDGSMPGVARMAVAPSSQRSVVHHHRPSAVRSVRAKACVALEAMGGESDRRVNQTLLDQSHAVEKRRIGGGLRPPRPQRHSKKAGS